MRRFAFIAVLAAALGLSAPSMVLAKSHRSARTKHARHLSHSRGHHKAAKARTVRFTPASVNSGSAGTTQSGTTTPAPDSIGSVGKYDATTHMLTINLNDNTTVTALADAANTEFECVSPSSTPPAQPASMRDHGGSGSDSSSTTSGSADSSSGSDDQTATQPTTTTTTTPPASESGDDNGAQDNEANDQGDANDADDQENGQAAAGCDSSLLVPGTVVREADMRITSSGSTFKKLVLFH